jgi:hypothetical protein
MTSPLQDPKAVHTPPQSPHDPHNSNGTPIVSAISPHESNTVVKQSPKLAHTTPPH